MEKSKAILIVLDGFGIGAGSAFNAIDNARMPFYRDLLTKYPHSQLLTHGGAVGLPDGVMGNSEVGHMTMGAGRIIFQDLTRISKSIRDGDFGKNPALRKTIEAGARSTGRVHFLGLLSDAGVHSDLSHLEALLDLSLELRVPEISVHAFTDGRDTPPHSARGYVERLLRHEAFRRPPGKGRAVIATIMGRYFAMDRDQRWERVAKAYYTMTGQVSAANTPEPLQALDVSHAAGKTDEFVEPLLLAPDAAIRDGDAAVFFNFRSDRAREISQAMTGVGEFSAFDRRSAPRLSAFCGMTVYDAKLGLDYAFGPQNLTHIFGEWLEEKGRTQFRLAETEKYAHVTFFFNGGRETPFKGEERLMIPSPRDVATYDLKPEMSAFAVADAAAEKIRAAQHDFILMNFANADMVGHTGNYQAVIRAVEALDQCLARVVGAAEKSGYHTLITADHGNAEEMVDCNGHLHTQHTLNPVPALWVAPDTANGPKSARQPMRDGGLSDLLPTLCQLMGLPLPIEVTGRSLIPT